LKQNVDRDRAIDRELLAAGWVVLRFWEHVSPESAREGVLSALTENENQDTHPVNAMDGG